MPDDLALAPAPVAMAAERRRLFLTVFPGVCVAMFLAAIDQAILAASLPSVAGDLGDPSRLPWVMSAYLMAATVAAPVYGRLGDALGRRRMLFVALGWFMAASVLCALAPTMLALVIARALQGLGGGGLMTLAQALIGEVVPPRERGRYMAYLASVFVLSSVIGPIAGGALSSAFGWQSVFLVNLPLGALAIALATRLPARRGGGERFRLDVWGVVLFGLVAVPLLVGIEGLQVPSWEALLASLPWFALTVAAGIGLVVWQRRARDPLFPAGLLADPVVWRSDVVVGCLSAVLLSAVTFVPLYLQLVRGYSPAQSGVALVPIMVAVVLASGLTGRLMAKTGRARVFPVVGLSMSAGGLACLALVPHGWVPGPVFAGVAAFGLGMVMPVMQVMVQVAAGPERLGSGTATVSLSRSLGGAVGTALVGAALFGGLAWIEPGAMEGLAEALRGGVGVAGLVEPLTEAFRVAFLAMAVIAAAGALVARTIPLKRI